MVIVVIMMVMMMIMKINNHDNKIDDVDLDDDNDDCHLKTYTIKGMDNVCHCTPATLAPAHTPCLFSIDLHTVRQHLVIVHFLLLLLLSGTLFQMMSGVPHHCHHLNLV